VLCFQRPVARHRCRLHQQQRIQRQPIQPLAKGEAVAFRQVCGAVQGPTQFLLQQGQQWRTGEGHFRSFRPPRGLY
jgi:hypothetical protein